MPALSKIPPGVIAPVKAKAAEIIAATGDDVTHVWGAGPNPDHNNLRCVDFMVASKAAGDRVTAYLLEHRNRLGIRLIIWYGRIMRFYAKPGIPAGTWSRYTGPNPHRDHPHVEFDSSAYNGAGPVRADGAAGWYHVDPAKVSTTLLGLATPAGERRTERKPGHNLEISHFVNAAGRRWAVTPNGINYAADFLAKGKAGAQKKPVEQRRLTEADLKSWRDRTVDLSIMLDGQDVDYSTAAVQQMLIAWRGSFAAEDGLSVSGIYGPLTRRCWREFTAWADEPNDLAALQRLIRETKSPYTARA